MHLRAAACPVTPGEHRGHYVTRLSSAALLEKLSGPCFAGILAPGPPQPSAGALWLLRCRLALVSQEPFCYSIYFPQFAAETGNADKGSGTPLGFPRGCDTVVRPSGRRQPRPSSDFSLRHYQRCLWLNSKFSQLSDTKQDLLRDNNSDGSFT